MPDSEIKLVLNRKIQAPVDRVYRAWITPEIMQQWFCPSASMSVPRVESDPREGGEYLIHMHDPDENADHIVAGRYEELIPNEKIVFNWKWKDGVDRTQVTVDLRANGDNETLLTLTHRGFGQQEFADKHQQGWTGCLDRLVEHVEA